MQAMNRFVEYFGAYMDEAGRLALADAAVVGMSTYHDRRELHIDLQLPALVETALERRAFLYPYRQEAWKAGDAGGGRI